MREGARGGAPSSLMAKAARGFGGWGSRFSSLTLRGRTDQTKISSWWPSLIPWYSPTARKPRNVNDVRFGSEAMSALPPKADIDQRGCDVRLCQ